MRSGLRVSSVALSLVLAAGCADGLEGRPDAALDGQGGEAPADSDADPDAQADQGPEDADAGSDGDAPDVDLEGPLTAIISGIQVLADRVCDLNGDGVDDNAVADVGSPGAEMFAVAATQMMEGGVDAGRARALFHFPWIDDLAGLNDSHAVLIVAEHISDDDDPPNLSDDYSGHEAFTAERRSVDACGEPVSYFPAVTIVSGRFAGSAAAVPTPGLPDLQLKDVRGTGTIEPGGAGLEVTLCAYVLAAELGQVPVDEGFLVDMDLNSLELFLSGGAGLGVPSMPGLRPDIDVDGDGLERFLLDDAYHIAGCIDGDLRVITGRECFLDSRIADGFSLTLHVLAVPARFAGRAPGLAERRLTCEDPPEQSLWDPI